MRVIVYLSVVSSIQWVCDDNNLTICNTIHEVKYNTIDPLFLLLTDPKRLQINYTGVRSLMYQHLLLLFMYVNKTKSINNVSYSNKQIVQC